MYAARLDKQKRLNEILHHKFVNDEHVQNAILFHAKIVAGQSQNSFSKFHFVDDLKETNMVKNYPFIITDPSIYIMGPRHSTINRKSPNKFALKAAIE